MSKEYISAESTQLEKEKKRLDRQYLKQRVEYLKQSRKIMERQRDALVKENKELKAKIESMVEPVKDEEVELPPQTSDLGTMYGSSDSWTLTTNADSNTQKSYERFSDASQKSKEMAL
ncbi:Oidioi.mRNA.OKI2018_I69.chr1.g1937.t1.cds [Oikopleura dioica]|uniref:Oidioi.mRNA.OKI2018_I69.chr1.g1937.t1.cds n=1 Tax=Oikopleura dioica TaxID=34765 RepID=A0ABN7SQ10_OIKDI|nr:Oidioi.mRNA.OKI2018_I69.chr1.g1937.t1.cds [Oikopleura dioica]